MKKGIKHFFEFWDINKSHVGRKFIDLFLDYDGTLTPIVETPEKAVLNPETRAVLEDLSNLPDVQLTIVSGRALNDLKTRVGVKNVVYVGNHGLEIEGKDIEFTGLIAPRVRSILGIIRSELPSQLSSLPGVFLEDKALTLSIHYRLVDEKSTPAIEKILDRVCSGYLQQKLIKMVSGKKVFEIRPAIEWDKGKAVSWLLQRNKNSGLAFYFGDDVTDEDAFKALNDRGVTVLVGQGKQSSAQYYVEDDREVRGFLKEIVKLKNKEMRGE